MKSTPHLIINRVIIKILLIQEILKRILLHLKIFYINGICLRINGNSYPSKPYQVDFGEGKYSMLYDDMIRNIGIGRQNESVGIALETYVKHKLLWIFDLTPGKLFNHTSNKLTKYI